MLQKLLIVFMSLLSLFATAQNQSEWKNRKGDITLFLANDLGRNGYYEQKPIAEQMGRLAEIIGPEAILALGDVHHFEGVQSVNDPLWMTNFESIYSHPELMIPWLPICGNHEYRGNTQAVLDYSNVSRRWMMPDRYYAFTFKDDSVRIKVIFMDTTPLIDKYRKHPDVYPDAAQQNMLAQLSWLDKELKTADEDWVVVVGHHPIYADTPKNESERTDMQARVDKILRKYQVDMYICGHIHNFQHIRQADSNIDYVVNSSASLSRPNVHPIKGSVFVSEAAGFSILTANAKELRLYMVDARGNAIHEICRRK